MNIKSIAFNYNQLNIQTTLIICHLIIYSIVRIIEKQHQ